MAQTIYGVLGIPDADYAFMQTTGQRAVFDATKQLLGDHNADLAVSQALFVEEETTDFKMRYYLSNGGRLERMPRQTNVAPMKATGSYDVAFPLEDFGARLAIDRVTMAYMTPRQYQRHLDAILESDRNMVRQAMLAALFNPADRAFKDELRGDLTVKPLANGDAVNYPPVIGSEDQATADHYIESGYIASAIDDTHNPVPTIINTLEQHFGTPTAGSPIAIFFNNAQTSQFQALTDFDPIENRFQLFGANVTQLNESYQQWALPGTVKGELNSALMIEWRWIPANYILGIHLSAPKPLARRVDPPQTELGGGLHLVSDSVEFPFRDYTWSHRYGYGVENRLNGVIMQLTAGSYAVPSKFANY